MELFKRYSDSDGDDLQAYGQMIERSSRVQLLLGPAGIMAQYVAPFRAFTVQNYEIILNALPSMRRDLSAASGEASIGRSLQKRWFDTSGCRRTTSKRSSAIS